MHRKPKILVVGSFVMDQIVTTSVFPREGQTVLGETFRRAPGGKGANQAVQAARLGTDVTLLGKLGQDPNGQELLWACQEAGVHTQYVKQDSDTASGCAVIVLEGQHGQSTQNRIIVIPGTNMCITPAEVTFLKESISDYDLVMLQLEIPMEINELVAGYAEKKGIPVMLNPAPSAPLSDNLIRSLTYISPNEHEAADLTGISIRHGDNGVNLADVRAAAEVLRVRGVENVLITLGSDGAAFLNGEGFFHSKCVPNITAVDPTAAGDSFVAAFCTGACCGWTWETVLDFATHTAALTVSNMGAMPSLPTLATVNEMMAGRRLSLPDTSYLK